MLTRPPYTYVPGQFLPRLKPAASGAFPAGPYAHRWFGRVTRDQIPIVVLSKRAVHGTTTHLVADRLGRWVAYTHDIATARRTPVGNSDPLTSSYLARAFGLAI